MAVLPTWIYSKPVPEMAMDFGSKTATFHGDPENTDFNS